MATSKERKLVESKSTTAVVRVYSQEVVLAFTSFMATLMDNVNVGIEVNCVNYVTFVIFSGYAQEDQALCIVCNNNYGVYVMGDLLYMGVDNIPITEIRTYEQIVDFVKCYCNLLLNVVEKYKADMPYKHEQVVDNVYFPHTRRGLIAYCRQTMRETEANDVEHKTAVKEVEAVIAKTSDTLKAMTVANKLNS